jgi:hypothetical protein
MPWLHRRVERGMREKSKRQTGPHNYTTFSLSMLGFTYEVNIRNK